MMLFMSVNIVYRLSEAIILIVKDIKAKVRDCIYTCKVKRLLA